MVTESTAEYLSARGLAETSPEQLNEALRKVLESMEPLAYEDPASGLTVEEQTVLKNGGLRLERTSGRDLMAETAVKYAAIVERSMTADEVSGCLGIKASRTRQMIASRALYSFLIDGSRLVPDFQFIGNKLVPNISQVNKVLPLNLHPVGIYNWFHMPNEDLFVDDKMESILTPLQWLKEGRDVTRVVMLAERL